MSQAGSLQQRALHNVLLAGIVEVVPVDVGDEWPAVIDLIGRERLWGLAQASVDAGELVMPSAGGERLRREARSSMVFAVTVDGLVSKIDDTLGAAGIEWRVLKGVATSHLLYDQPALRDVGDIDILVREADFEGAASALAGDGIRPREFEAPGDTHRAMGYARTLLDPVGIEVDLHRRVSALDRWGRLDEAYLFSAPTSVRIGGRTVEALSWNAMFAHACLHLASQQTRASTLGDVIRFARHPQTDPERFLDECREDGVLGYVDWALEQASEVHPLPWQFDAARARRPVRLGARMSARYAQTHPSAAKLGNILEERERVRLLLELVWPSRRFLHSVDRTRLGHLGYVLGSPVRFLWPRRSKVGAARRR